MMMVVALAAACGGSDGGGEECTPACDGKLCGDNGCGGTCGDCGADETCNAGVCEGASTPACDDACTGLECGTVADADGNDCNCGSCEGDDTCDATGKCISPNDPCAGACAAGECGIKNVEGTDCDCGQECGEGEACNETLNKCECVPICADPDSGEAYECGSDGCEADCGTCAQGACEDHVCKCDADCDGKECGADGCGGTCGDCGDKSCDLAQGVCVDECVLPEAFGDVVSKLNYMAVGAGGHAGEALDVDNDPDTCAPAGDCEDGLNNQLSGLLGNISAFVDPDAEIEKALAEGQIILLAESTAYTTDGTPFTVNMYMGEVVEPVEACDVQTAVCDYYVKPDSFDVYCDPLIAFDNATINGTALAAGGPDYQFAISIPVQEGLIFNVTANMAQLVGVMAGEGDDLTITDGLIGGAVRKDKLMEAIDLVPAETWEELPVGKDMVKNLLDMFVEPDVDTDDDGELDAASVGVKFGAIAGNIVGLEPAE